MKKCLYCQKPLEDSLQRTKTKFCNDSHKVMFYRKQSITKSGENRKQKEGIDNTIDNNKESITIVTKPVNTASLAGYKPSDFGYPKGAFSDLFCSGCDNMNTCPANQ